MEINIEVVKRDIVIPPYVLSKMKELGIEELPRIKNLIGQYVEEAGTPIIDWYYFNQWVAMGYSDH